MAGIILSLEVLKSMNLDVFEAYISKLLVSQLLPGAIVVIDNLPAYKVEAIVSLIEAVGVKVIYMSPYSLEFNPIEHWWS